MDKEIWKDIKGYEGLYAVSNCGRVKSLGNDKSRKEKILRPCKDGWGYLFVTLYKEGKAKLYKVHRLVLMNFSPVDGMENLDCNHIDENKENNRLENLEWCDRSYNLTYNDRHKRVGEKNTNGKKSIPIVQLTPEGKYIRSYKSSMDAERTEGGFNHSSIIACCKGKLKTHKGYRFMYLSEFLDKNCGIID